MVVVDAADVCSGGGGERGENLLLDLCGYASESNGSSTTVISGSDSGRSAMEQKAY
jgi:hypothetical protein